MDHSSGQAPVKPTCLRSELGRTVFTAVGRASRALKDAGQHEQAEKMTREAFSRHNFREVVGVLQRYVTIIEQ